MKYIRDLFKSLIILLSEILWIYYLISLFTSIRWNEPVFANIIYWLLAGGIGYILNSILLAKAKIPLLITGNILFSTFILVQNWRQNVPKASLGYGLAMSIGLVTIITRSLSLAHRQPNRRVMLSHFEGNIGAYIILSGIFVIRGWEGDGFHFLFVSAIFLSLMGMMFVLDNYTGEESSYLIETRRVGNSGWFSLIMTLALAIVPLASLALILSPARQTVYIMVASGWEAIKGIFLFLTSIINWFMGLIPDPPIVETIPNDPIQGLALPKQEEKIISSLPYILMLASMGILILVGLALRLLKLIKDIRRPKPMQVQDYYTIEGGWWRNLLGRVRKLFVGIRIKIRKSFAYFYHYPVYWQYYQIEKWGKKNGLARDKTQTSREYIMEIIEKIPEEANSFTHKNHKYHISDLLRELNLDYESTYYGRMGAKSTRNYKFLLRRLREIELNL